jgi:electron transfer flavoprotein alpha subunit
MTGGIWIFAEHKDDEFLETSLELICEGKRLADRLKETLNGVLFGHAVTSLAESLALYGVNTVFAADHPSLSAYRPELYTTILAGLTQSHNPVALLFASTAAGQDLATRVAARLRTILAPNCDKFQVSPDGRLLLNRLMYQSKVHATLATLDARPLLATVVPGISKIKKTNPCDGFSVIKADTLNSFVVKPEKIENRRFIQADPKSVDIPNAERIISGGKGVGDEQGFDLITELAEALDASVAGSRAAVDNRWIGRERQIGQSGKTVAPSLMISCGISGAGAHIFGMKETQTLIAINKDKAAPIMKMADLGVIGDLHAILPELIKQIKEQKK